MRSTKRAIGVVVVTVILLALLSGCVGFYLAVPGQVKGSPPAKRAPQLPPIRNNATVRLEAADYVGDLSVSANKVTIVGRGYEVTRILGNVVITGNNCVMRQLTITGSVRISGNNADLRDARIQGAVRSTGNNNLW
jgi:hypothetical protein